MRPRSSKQIMTASMSLIHAFAHLYIAALADALGVDSVGKTAA